MFVFLECRERTCTAFSITGIITSGCKSIQLHGHSEIPKYRHNLVVLLSLSYGNGGAVALIIRADTNFTGFLQANWFGL